MPAPAGSFLPSLRRIALAVPVALALVAAAPAGTPMADGAQFLADVDDLPLPEGMVEDPDARVAFDEPGGRVVEAAASGPLEPEAVTEFYRETLPALGWTSVGPGVWRRDGEELRVAVVEAGPPVRVQFTIAPDGHPDGQPDGQ